MISRIDDERGFTLMELLLVIAILGLIAVPLSASLVVGLRTTDATANRLDTSHDAQLVSLYLPADIQSAGNAAGDIVASPTPGSACSLVQNLLQLRWTATEAEGDPVTYTAAYAVAKSGDEWQLTRYFCSTKTGQIVTTVVAHKLGGASAGSVTVSGTQISMTLTEATIPASPTPYSYTISGIRRTT
jgi:prepilin-type N-terminal cleavage/methylation domain-containing protein